MRGARAGLGSEPGGPRVAVIGLGHVGGRLARRLAAGGARLIVADVDPGKRALADELGARWVTPDVALRPRSTCSPRARWAACSTRRPSRAAAPVVAGAANNQLADDAIAEALAARGMLWAPDFVVNAGGIINIAVELEGATTRPSRAAASVGSPRRSV